MTTDRDRTARLEFTAAAFVSYALRKEHPMTTTREYCPHCRRELCPSEGRIFAGICIDCFLADKEPPPVAHEAQVPTTSTTQVPLCTACCRHYCICDIDESRYAEFATKEADYRAWLAEARAGWRSEDMTNGGIEPAWCPCGAPIPDEGDACPDCAQQSVPEDVKAMKPYRALIALAALALSLTTHTAGAGAIYTPTSPHNDCTDTGEITEFGGPILDCDGTPIYQDMDGQIYENAAGYPVYEPGTWVTLTYP
jgi:hypothetical protein